MHAEVSWSQTSIYVHLLTGQWQKYMSASMQHGFCSQENGSLHLDPIIMYISTNYAVKNCT
ncbi:hypothetical protein EWM64_g8657 [Hericium alpestre]|uniref:Uncharacterized protein n=1 Tax=Hericium alpestre TaxID=135208 RepID=A0A4Y9ZM51_9AGAM|nr:hypothetical protein EWM64_g8657 [Hericium alpestre]